MLTGAAGRRLDVGDPDQRSKAVRATIGASTSLLGRPDASGSPSWGCSPKMRPFRSRLAAALWQATGGLDRMTAVALCARLAELALVALAPGGTAGRSPCTTWSATSCAMNSADARLAAERRAAGAAAQACPPRQSRAAAGVVAWWELPEEARYCGTT